ncbi:hypothetical protein BaRGS_00030830, partial [Batillaria attramentaria]
VIVFVHFILSTWGSLGNWNNGTYLYVHAFVLACGLWAIISSDSTDAVLMMLISLAFSILHDIILLGLYEPRGYDTFERSALVSASHRNEYRFGLGMCITNLILKPLTGFLLFRIYQSRRNESTFTIPGISNLPGLGTPGSGYEDIDKSPHAPYSTVESAQSHDTVAK